MMTTAQPQGMPHLQRTPRMSDSLCALFDLGNSQALSRFPMFFSPHLLFSLFCLYSVSSLPSLKKKKKKNSLTQTPPPIRTPPHNNFSLLSPSPPPYLHQPHPPPHPPPPHCSYPSPPHPSP